MRWLQGKVVQPVTGHTYLQGAIRARCGHLSCSVCAPGTLFDLILNCASGRVDTPSLLAMLYNDGTLVQVGGWVTGPHGLGASPAPVWKRVLHGRGWNAQLLDC